MPKRVYNNVVGNKVIDNGREAEDITQVILPTISHPTTEIKAAGMAMDVNMPDTNHLNAMELSIAHNNGVNCRYLRDPGKHFIELRIVRQRYDVTGAEIEHELFKARFTCVHVSTERGNVENGNPMGSTEKFSVLRYEEEVDGEITTIADAMAGLIRFNGKDCTDIVESMLS